MSESTVSPQFRRICLVSRILQWACVVGMIAPPLFLLWAVAMTHYEGTQWTVNDQPVEGPFKDPLLIDLGWVVGFLPTIALIWGMNQLRHLFAGFSVGRIFSVEHVAHLFRFGKAVLLYAVACPFTRAINSMVDTIGQEEHSVHFYLDSADVQAALVGLFFYVLGWVFREGARLSEENAQIV